MTPDSIINDLQQRFREQYAYLDIKFYRILLRGEGHSTIKKFCDTGKALGEELVFKKEGAIEISDDMTVDDLVREFHGQFGVNVQVFRKSANLWMEITLTNNWTLRQQNNHGREISV